MDQKNKIVARLQEKFSGFSLPGAVAGEKPVTNTEAAAQVSHASAPVTEEKKAMVLLADRIAHLDSSIRGQVEQLIDLERNFPIRGFLTADQMRAGIIFADSVKDLHWPEFCRYSRLFFGPAHEAICTVFKKELQAVARRYGKTSIIKSEDISHAE